MGAIYARAVAVMISQGTNIVIDQKQPWTYLIIILL